MYNKNVYQAFTKGIFNMVLIHKYSHVVQNIFSMTVCVYPSFSVHEI